MLTQKATLRRRFIPVIMAVALLATACGSDPEVSVPTALPTATTAPTNVPTPTDESEESGGVIRTIRGAPGAVWDGVTWVWDRGSDGVGFVWGGIRSGTGFLWDKVTGLPATAWDVITSFLRERVQVPLDRGIEVAVEFASSLNPVGFLENLIIGLLKIVGLIALIILVFFGVLRWRLWTHVVRLFWGSAEKGLSKIPTPVASPSRQSTHEASSPKPSTTVERKTNPGSPLTPSTQPVVSRTEAVSGEEWSRSQIRELRDRVTSETITVLFGRASRLHGQAVADLDLMRATGRSRAEVRADLSAFDRVSASVNPEGKMPIEIIEATADGCEEAYRVPDQYLEWWFEE